MSLVWRKAAVAACLLAAAALWGAPVASAAITGSHIDTPTDPSFGIYNQDSPSTIAISGTTTGGTPGVDQVDVVCTNRDGSDVTVVDAGLTIGLDGSFSDPTVDPNPLTFRHCILRAYPAGTTPADPSPFTGPSSMWGYRNFNVIVTGPNAGTHMDYYVWAQQQTGAFDYDSAGVCGVCDGYLFNSNLDQTATTFFGNDYFNAKETLVSPTRSQIQVDGVDAYTPGAAATVNSQAGNFPATTYNVSQDASNGDTTITESEEIVKCTDTTFPPNNTKCATFVDTGVTLDRTIVQDHDGHLATVTDDWASTDASTHSLDLLPENDQDFHDVSGSAAGVAYEFPGETGYSTHAPGDVVNFGGGSPGAVFIKQQSSPDDATGDGQGAIIFDRPANPATFINKGVINAFNFHQTGTVPDTGALTIRTAYAQAYTCAEVASLAQAAAVSFGGSVASPCPSPPSGGGGGGANPPPSNAGPTGLRAKALKKCKKKHKKTHNKKAFKKCRKKAKRLPV
jgi:hypothetical protein